MIKWFIAAVEVLYWFFSGASLMYPDMTRWEIAKKIWHDVIHEDDDSAS
jgi:hypothetical protein